MTRRINKYLDFLYELISSQQYSFDENLFNQLPTSPGIYRIFKVDSNWKSTLRAGRTKTGQEGLQQRIYRNHYQGNQNGNIRQQLIAKGICNDLNDTKKFLEVKCKVQILVIEDAEERKWAEYFMLSILQPELCD